MRTLYYGRFSIPIRVREEIGPWFSLLERFICTLPMIFLATATPTLLAFALLTPAGYVPDQSSHLVRAASLLHGELTGSSAIITKPNVDPA